MWVKLALGLAIQPEEAWPRFAASCESDEPPPPAITLISWVALGSVLATTLGSMLEPTATAGGVLAKMFVTTAGYVGGGVLSVRLSWRYVQALPGGDIQRFAQGTAIPVVASGVFNLIPVAPVSVAIALAGAAMSLWSGWIGASAMLGLEGEPRLAAAKTAGLLAAGPVLLSAVVRWLLPA